MRIVKGMMVFFRWAFGVGVGCLAVVMGLLVYAWAAGLCGDDDDDEEVKDER